jgi:DNA-directed RNA polymerase subunit N (RpoN/RPB10)
METGDFDGQPSQRGAKIVSQNGKVARLVRMIIPIRCMNCGKPIADKWLQYKSELHRLKGDQAEVPHYIDGTTVPNTIEKQLLDKLRLYRICCRKHFLTQKDLMDKI